MEVKRKKKKLIASIYSTIRLKTKSFKLKTNQNKTTEENDPSQSSVMASKLQIIEF